MIEDIPSRWAKCFGLAMTPLFGKGALYEPKNHHVLLDGGQGSFALSVGRELSESLTANCSWSSDLPHHVTVTEQEVTVIRWDTFKTERFTLSSVEDRSAAFYDYLVSDRIKSTRRVVDHMIDIFRRIRSLVTDSGLDDYRSIDAYLEFLVCFIERSHDDHEDEFTHAVEANHQEIDTVLASVSPSGLNSLFEEARSGPLAERSLMLLPDLAIRHAGSEIFQEAHFEFVRTSSTDLFGYTAPAKSQPITRNVTHFTPPALARTIVEQSLDAIPNLSSRDQLVVLDPACGSGAFLHETLRTLRQRGFKGRLVLRGFDISQPAVAMANFVLRHACADWEPKGGCEFDVKQCDSLESSLPQADIIQMNPPFVSWLALSPEQRRRMREILGKRMEGQGDLSLAFVMHSLAALPPGGVLGTLLPASFLALRAAETWRKEMLETTEVKLLASFGDYGLFTYAHVQVGAAIFRKTSQNTNQTSDVIALVTGGDPKATGDALRTLRHPNLPHSQYIGTELQQLFRIPIKNLRQRSTWRLTPPRIEMSLQKLFDLNRVSAIGDLFSVHQGVRTGLNKAFLFKKSEIFDGIPEKEREWFRPAIMNDSINGGLIRDDYRVFYPYGDNGPKFETVEQLKTAVPTYFEKHLRIRQRDLESRWAIKDTGRDDWWGLSRPRPWILNIQPRIVSKYFGGLGSFAIDSECQYVVVQGNAWIPKFQGIESIEYEGLALSLGDILTAYLTMLNSPFFMRVVEIFSPRVAGGQFDLSNKYISQVPIPRLTELAVDERDGRTMAG